MGRIKEKEEEGRGKKEELRRRRKKDNGKEGRRVKDKEDEG